MIEAQTVFAIIIAIIFFNYLIERVLDYLNLKNWSNQIPDELQEYYDLEKVKKALEYHREKDRFKIHTSTSMFVLILAFLFFDGFAFVDNYVRGITTNPIPMALLFFGILGLASDLIMTPFSIYNTFVIEEKFGFNKTTPKTFILDKLKGYILSALIGGALLSLIVWFYLSTGPYFWLYAWGLVIIFMVFMTMFFSSLILPLFNKLEPLKEGELRSAIEAFCEKAGFKMKDLFVMDGSKRSTKANAFFSGLGAKKKIVLFDTLVEKQTTEEIVAVLAHEIGHYKKKHSLKGMFLSIVETGLMLFLLSLFISSPVLAEALGASTVSFHIGALAFSLLYSPLSLVLGLLMNFLSRKNEFEADRFAKSYQLSEPLQTALKKLSVDHLSNLHPHPAYVFFHYSHPPLLKRLAALKA